MSIREAVRTGLYAGLISLSVSAIGMVQSFDERDIITNFFSLGQLLLFGAPFFVGYLIARRDELHQVVPGLLNGFVAGAVTALPVIGLIGLASSWQLIRSSLVNVSPQLIEILTLGAGPVVGSLLLALVMGVLGALGVAIHLPPERYRRALINGLVWTVVIGMLSEILINVLRPLLGRSVMGFLFGTKGITLPTAVILFVAIVVGTYWWRGPGQGQFERLPPLTRRLLRTGLVIVIVLIASDVKWVYRLLLLAAVILLDAAALLGANRGNGRSQTLTSQAKRWSPIVQMIVVLGVMPWIFGIYLSEVVDKVGLFILMGLGLNIVVGFAGLLDLGYVAFYAIGAYTMGILTSQGGLGIANLSFWAALPICVAASTIAGMMLGLPVLRMRGDYLAIVTLGFGEIIRVLVTSDLLKPYIGGAQGILQIPKPQAFGFTFIQPQHSYYIILVGCAIAVFLTGRLRDARLGRQWMALREDEDVAEAMGIHLVKTKLLAFGIGAAFSGLAGAIFASRISSIFPASFDLLISINVLSLIIVGGMGSVPGVVVGALVLVGLPELLREFAEYRLLLYGVLLIAMMIVRPEGLWPSPVRQRELHAEEDLLDPQLDAS